MPPISKDAPENLRPYIFHGVDLQYRNGDRQATADCPFCGREGKFTVEIATGKFRCFVCAEGNEKGGGNATVFIRQLWKLSFDATKPEDYQELANERGFLYFETPMYWEFARSIITGNWLIPGYNVGGSMVGLYQRIEMNPKPKLLPTPTLGHSLHGVNLYDAGKPIVYLCEGPWDGPAFWEVLGHAKSSESGLVATANQANSLLAEANVLAVPGCETFFDSWLPLFAGKIVNLMFDNDHERKHPKTGKRVAPAGYNGMRRIAGILSGAKEPPEEINYLAWGGERGWNPDLPSGFDLRDALIKGKG